MSGDSKRTTRSPFSSDVTLATTRAGAEIESVAEPFRICVVINCINPGLSEGKSILRPLSETVARFGACDNDSSADPVFRQPEFIAMRSRAIAAIAISYFFIINLHKLICCTKNIGCLKDE